LIDVGPVPRKNSISFGIKVKKLVEKKTILGPFVPTSAVNTTFEIEAGLGIKVDKVFANATVSLRFTFPMQLYMNPTFTESDNRTTTVAQVLP
jgi:hypothetical protein